jgi:hypothetical protein
MREREEDATSVGITAATAAAKGTSYNCLVQHDEIIHRE